MNKPSKSNFAPILTLACAATTFACSASEEELLEMTVTEVGLAGGTARSSDGLLSVEFSNGALGQSTDITVTVFRGHGQPGVVSPIYELGPDGLEFNGPVTLTIDAPDEVGALALANLDGPTPAVLADSAQSGTAVSGTLAHFSSYGVVAAAAAMPTYDPCGGRACGDACTVCAPNDSTCTEPSPANKICGPAGACLDPAVVQCGPGVSVMTSSAAVTGGSTSVLLDLAALSGIGLDVSGVSEVVMTPGDLGADSVAFPINPSTGAGRLAPTTFAYDFVNFAPLGGTIEHDGLLYFDQQFASGNFSIGFDAARATGGNSGFFVESTTEGFLLISGVFFDVAAPSFVDAQPTSLVIEADLIVAPELAAFLNRPAVAGTDVGDARIAATAVRF